MDTRRTTEFGKHFRVARDLFILRLQIPDLSGMVAVPVAVFLFSVA